ncbi:MULTISPECIES: hypothetical protein [Sutcliffiella]|uniref:hypothetical protein n=1 Tax=Sutcliffiella TaxID=2837511 RepID=UPI0022DCFA09|nr:MULTISPECIES: hypothetical protein [Sutcliffiella]MED4019106.1 hypothetical protein [Sutcliffiella cohnii]WBL13800.1 hypothetical protein O1A01_18050 [Sutcliffiella sp. NC1]
MNKDIKLIWTKDHSLLVDYKIPHWKLDVANTFLPSKEWEYLYRLYDIRAGKVYKEVVHQNYSRHVMFPEIEEKKLLLVEIGVIYEEKFVPIAQSRLFYTTISKESVDNLSYNSTNLEGFSSYTIYRKGEVHDE